MGNEKNKIKSCGGLAGAAQGGVGSRSVDDWARGWMG